MPAAPPPAAPFDAALIDLDGTLVDTLGDFERALGLMLSALHLPGIGRPFIERTVGRGSEYLIEKTLAQVGAPAERYEEAFASYQAHYAVVNGRHSSVYPGAEAGVERLLQRGLRLVCLTNKPGALAVGLLRAKGLERHFTAIYGGDAFERKKPHPMPLLRACESLGTAPARTLMIGDSSNDAQAARAAGCPVVLVTYGYNHGEPVTGVDADGHVDRIDALDLEAVAARSR